MLKPRAAGCVLEIVANDRAGQAMYVQDAYIPPNGRKLLISP